MVYRIIIPVGQIASTAGETKDGNMMAVGCFISHVSGGMEKACVYATLVGSITLYHIIVNTKHTALIIWASCK